MKPIKILHIITGLNSGGAENVMCRIIKNTPEINHIVVSLSKGGIHEQTLRNNRTRVYQLETNFFSICSTIFQLIKIYDAIKPDIVQTWLIHGDLIGAILKIFRSESNLVWNIRHSDYSFRKTKIRTWPVLITLVFFSRILPNKILTCASSIRELYVKFGYPSKKFHVIPNGTSVSLGIEGKYLKKLYKKNPSLDLLYLGRNHPQKNLKVLIQAVAALISLGFNLKLTLVGKDNEKLLNFVLKLPENVRQNIFLNGEKNDVRPYFSQANVLILPSSYGEGFPNVLIESMAEGIPCISSDVGDARHIIGNTGWLYKKNSMDELMLCIRQAYEEINHNPRLFLERRAESKTRVSKLFSLDVMIDNYRQFYLTIL